MTPASLAQQPPAAPLGPGVHPSEHRADPLTLSPARSETGPQPFAPIVDPAEFPQRRKNVKPEGSIENTPPKMFSVADLLELDIPPLEMLIEGLLQKTGLVLVVGKPKSGKSVLSAQMAISVASGHALLDNYRVFHRGPAMYLGQDDTNSTASIKDILAKSTIPVTGIPFCFIPKVSFGLGDLFIDWLKERIYTLNLRLVVLDSYTALRGSRKSGCDLVKVEQRDMLMLDELAIQTGCSIVLLHHGSKGAAGMDWTEQAAGSFAMTAAVQSQIHIARFKELDSNSPERLVRVQGRHLPGTDFVMRFRLATIDYEHVLESGAAPEYPQLLVIKKAFGSNSFSPKRLCFETGISRATAHRLIGKLLLAGVIRNLGGGDYELDGF